MFRQPIALKTPLLHVLSQVHGTGNGSARRLSRPHATKSKTEMANLLFILN